MVIFASFRYIEYAYLPSEWGRGGPKTLEMCLRNIRMVPKQHETLTENCVF